MSKPIYPSDYDAGYDDDPTMERIHRTREERERAIYGGNPDSKELGAASSLLVEAAGYARIMAPACESPIELDFGSALTKLLEGRFIVKPQYQLGRFRYDFSVWRPGETRPFALIECDSRQFHSTDAQIANDIAKDKAAGIARLAIFRVTGRDIWRDHFKAARSIAELLK